MGKPDQVHAVRMVAVDLIDAGANDRQTFDATELTELADSIAHHGLAQPPTLRPMPDGRFTIVAGERRTRAMRDVLGWTEIPAMVRKMSDSDASAIMLVENLQRADLDPMEEARAYAVRVDGFGMTPAEVAAMASVPIDRVRRRLALLSLSDRVAHYVSTKQLPLAYAGLMTTLDANRQHLALEAYNGSPMTLEAFRMLCARLQGEQDADPLFDPDAFFQVEEYTATAFAEAEANRPKVETVREPVLGAHEIADLLRVKRTTVHQWRTRRLFPDPDLSVGAQPAWYRSTVTDWAARSGRAVQGSLV